MADKKSEAVGLVSLGLQNRLLEVAAIVGMDNDTGLQIRKTPQDVDEEAISKSVFECDFQGFLLDVLSGPQENMERGSSNNGDSSGSGLKKFSLKRRNGTTAKHERSQKHKVYQRKVSVRRLRTNANKNEEVPVSTDFLGNMPSVCLPDESKVYNHPKMSSIHSTVLTDIDGFRHYAVILTFYQEFYATKTGAEYWTLERNVNIAERCIVNGNDHGPCRCYVPCCICFVSTEPYLSVLKDALSCLHKEYLSKNAALRKTVEKYVTNLSLVVCPPPSVRIRFSLGSLPVVLPPSDMHENIIDVDLRLPLFIFLRQPTVLMNVLACIMHEQRIVFFSSDFTLIPLVMECFLQYIRPFRWHHQYIPVLFSEIIGFVECPGIFMMGCHSRHRQQVEKIENDLFLVDLDNGTIQTNSNSSTETDGGCIGQFALDMPDFAVQNLLVRLKDFQLHNSVTSVCQVNPVTLEEIREHNLKIRQNVNQKILNIFMEFMVDIFGSTLHYLDHEHQQFNANKFLESINPTDSPFYIKSEWMSTIGDVSTMRENHIWFADRKLIRKHLQVSKSYMFRRFIRQRLHRTTDHFSALAEKRSKLQRNGKDHSINHGHSSSLNSLQRKNTLFIPDNLSMDHFCKETDKPKLSTRVPSSSSGSNISEETSTLNLVLPSFPVQGTNFNSKHFYQRCINMISETLKSNMKIADHSSQRAALLFLRGLYHLAEDNLVEGLKDLTATAKEDARFYPEKILNKIASSLNEQELRTAQQHTLLRNVKMSSLKRPSNARTLSVVRSQIRSYFTDDNTAVYSLDKEPFAFVLEKEEMTTDQYVLSTLFDALCHCSNPTATEVEPEVFNAFNQTWQQFKRECIKAHKNLGEDVCRVPTELQSPRSSTSGTDQYLIFLYNEKILKISEIAFSNKGNGRLILTTKRLIFIGAGNNECKEIIPLEKILFLKEGKIKNFLSSTPAMYIIKQNAGSDNRFKIGLKSKCSLWIHLIEEMRAGRKRSHDQCDDHLALTSAAQNVLIADTFFSSAVEEGYMKPDVALEWISRLCKFESQMQSGELTSFSPETQEMLTMVKDMSPKETKKSGVRALAYSSTGIDETPHIFTMLDSGKLRLLDTTTWDLDPKPIKEWETIPSCLLLVADKELWIGFEDGSICVLSLSTMKITRILHDHDDAVVAITHTIEGYIASGDRAGKVIIWDPEASQVYKSFKAYHEPVHLVSIMTYKSLLCCCTTIHIIICDYDGNQMQCFEAGETPVIRLSNLTCFTWDDTDEIWAGDDHGAIYTWDVDLMRGTDSVTRPKLAGVISDTSITCMIKYQGKLWAGNTEGEIIIFNTDEPREERSIKAHSGTVTAVLALENRYMISTSGEDDGKLVLWRQYKK